MAFLTELITIGSFLLPGHAEHLYLLRKPRIHISQDFYAKFSVCTLKLHIEESVLAFLHLYLNLLRKLITNIVLKKNGSYNQ